MEEENAINFLLYSYFELTLDSNENEILDATISRAYRDASSRVLSVNEETNKYIKDDGEEVSLRIAVSKLIKEKLNDPPCNYNAWFYNTCKEVQNIYASTENKEGKSSFNFGHAQKWVNMTMKYLCVIKNVFNIYGKIVLPWLTDELENQLHIPVDSHVMEAAVTPKAEEGLGVELPCKNNKSGKTRSYRSANAWSTWSEEDYKFFRNQIEGKLSKKTPLDWESHAWIEIAKIRKEREEKSKK